MLSSLSDHVRSIRIGGKVVGIKSAAPAAAFFSVRRGRCFRIVDIPLSLCGEELVILAVKSHQLAVVAFFNDLAALEDDDLACDNGG